jgi:lipoprotein-anchoring transpeptidase ErfK/SrfK
MPSRAVVGIFSATVVLVATAVDVNAQGRGWVPWTEIGPGPAAQPRAERAPAPPPVAAAPRRQRDAGSGGSAFSNSGRSPAIERSAVGPAFLDGGARPAISASTPPKVAFTGYATGSIIVDTGGRALYYVTSPTEAYRYPISVGRDGFTWRGTQTVTRVASWPDWRPPAEMRERDPRLPELMSGGLRNPLGAKALYLGSTLYRIHGTNDLASIGNASSSGCFRMSNSHVTHLAGIAGVGTRVTVVDSLSRTLASRGSRRS